MGLGVESASEAKAPWFRERNSRRGVVMLVYRMKKRWRPSSEIFQEVCCLLGDIPRVACRVVGCKTMSGLRPQTPPRDYAEHVDWIAGGKTTALTEPNKLGTFVTSPGSHGHVHRQLRKCRRPQRCTRGYFLLLTLLPLTHLFPTASVP